MLEIINKYKKIYWFNFIKNNSIFLYVLYKKKKTSSNFLFFIRYLIKNKKLLFKKSNIRYYKKSKIYILNKYLIKKKYIMFFNKLI